MTMPGTSKNNLTTLLIPVIIAYITLQVYSLSLGNAFVNWDDHKYVLENPDILLLNADFLRYSLTATVVSNWHPLTLLSYAVDYRLWGYDPWGYHLTNILLHGFNTVMVLIIIKRLTTLATKKPPPRRQRRYCPLPWSS